jgi:hypothetical protein
MRQLLTVEFNDKGELMQPAGYREWVFLSSGLGMTYGPSAPAAGTRPRFDNVWVNPSSYRQFKQTGTWPEGTIFILEIRESEQKASINQHGHFQGKLVAIEANVKDTSRFPQTGWGFFDLATEADGQPKPVKAIAQGNGCQKCHSANGAVDGTFVQFYPELIPIAKKFGTFKVRPEPTSTASH